MKADLRCGEALLLTLPGNRRSFAAAKAILENGRLGFAATMSMARRGDGPSVKNSLVYKFSIQNIKSFTSKFNMPHTQVFTNILTLLNIHIYT